MEIDARLDLHGMTQARAHSALSGFIAASYNAGCRCVLVITGKGSKDGERKTGVLKENVPLWLCEMPNSPVVLKFMTAQPKDGGSGALYVYLRRKKS